MSLISTKQTITTHLKRLPLNIKKSLTYGIGNAGLGMRQAQKCEDVTPVNAVMMKYCRINTLYKYMFIVT